MSVDDEINIIRRQSPSSQTLSHIWISGEWLPCADVFLNRLRISLDVSSEA